MKCDEWIFSLLYRAASTQSVDKFPSASKIERKKEEIIPCHICERNKDKEETTAADMYCYNCDNVFCDEHSGVSKREKTEKLLFPCYVFMLLTKPPRKMHSCLKFYEPY